MQRNIDDEVALFIRINRLIGSGDTLTDEEKESLVILASARSHLERRERWGDDYLTEDEKHKAGTTTKKFDV